MAQEVQTGGREHAITWKLADNEEVSAIFVAPGNAGTESIEKAENIPDLDIKKSRAVVQFCGEQKISLVVVGPEDPLANGLADTLRLKGVPCFGPIAAAAKIESSKAYSKHFMKWHGIPTARFEVFTNCDEAIKHIRQCKYRALVVKASGLAAGKGVRVCRSVEEACCAAYDILVKKVFGSAGSEIVIEELLEGPEVSAMCFTDGDTVRMMPISQDHKRLGEGDKGPNTGGMGAYAPCPLVDEDTKLWIKEQILEKTVHSLRNEAIHYSGVLYAGLMLTGDGPKVLEFNCRFGDPETQALLPLLDSDLLEIMEKCTQGTLSSLSLQWKGDLTTCGVVAVSQGYPGTYKKGMPIQGLEPKTENWQNRRLFLAGTKKVEGGSVVNGGRVFCVVGLGRSLSDARKEAMAGIESIHFEGKSYRKDIGYQSLKENTGLSYEKAGVSVAKGNELVERIKPSCMETRRKGCEAIGGFGACVDLGIQGYKEPVLVLGTDGVGTKLLIAQEYGKLDNIGEDLVGMCVNDVLCHGAEPVAFLDYYSTGQLDVDSAAEVIRGIARGCKIAGCALVGGETAEMPGMYEKGVFDLAGFAVGVRERSHPELPNKKVMKAGDAVLGLSSSGVHSNGLSLVRRIVTGSGLTYAHPTPWGWGSGAGDAPLSLGDSILTPTRIYVKDLLGVLRSGLIKGAAHITGGGLLENIPRMLPEELAAELEEEKWEMYRPKVFDWLMIVGGVEKGEMLRTFNYGLGMILIVDGNDAEEVCRRCPAFPVGCLRPRPQGGEGVRVMNSSMDKDVSVTNGMTNGEATNGKDKVRVAVLISGTGTNLNSLIENSRNPESYYEISFVISNVEGAGGLAIAQKNGIKNMVIPHKKYSSRELFEDDITKALEAESIELICLAGFMRILHKKFVERWSGRVLNIHPSLLPSFRGANAHKMAIAAGVKISGCTVHYVAEEVDSGAIICQAAVPVLEGDTEDTLAQRVKTEEHTIFPRALQMVAEKLLQAH